MTPQGPGVPADVLIAHGKREMETLKSRLKNVTSSIGNLSLAREKLKQQQYTGMWTPIQPLADALEAILTSNIEGFYQTSAEMQARYLELETSIARYEGGGSQIKAPSLIIPRNLRGGE